MNAQQASTASTASTADTAGTAGTALPCQLCLMVRLTIDSITKCACLSCHIQAALHLQDHSCSSVATV